jgi:hypothetical protein
MGKKEGFDRVYTLSLAATPLVCFRMYDPVLSLDSIPPLPVSKSRKMMALRWGFGQGCTVLQTQDEGFRIPDAILSAKAPQQLVGALREGAPLFQGSNIHLLVFAVGFGVALNPNDPMMTEALLQAIPVLKQSGVTLVSVDPPEFSVHGGLLDRYIEYVDCPLPTAKDLQDLYQQFVEQNRPLFGKSAEADGWVGEALKGLTVWQAEQALSEYVVREHRAPAVTDLLEAKQAIISSSPALTLITSYPHLEEVKGLGALKDFILSTATSKLSRGVALVGPPGVGKTMTAKACAAVIHRPLVSLNLSAVFGGVVGASEANVRRAIDTVKAVAPCLLFVDELEKVLSGVASSGQSDGGTTDRVAREFLTFLQDRPEGVYVVATLNDPLKIPPEYLRAERWDAFFFLDLPPLSAREEMLVQYKSLYGIQDNTVSGRDLEGWTGAEIATLCRIAAMRSESGVPTSLLEARSWVVPQIITRKEEIESLRAWAKGKCVSADVPLSTTPPQGRLRGSRNLGLGVVN